MTPERKYEIRTMLGEALRADYEAAGHVTAKARQEALVSPEFRTPNLKAATESLGKEYNQYAAQRGARPLQAAMTYVEEQRGTEAQYRREVATPARSKWERDEKTLRLMERDGATEWSR